MTTKWIDHFLTSSHKLCNLTIHYEMAFYDHIPMSFQYDMGNVIHKDECVDEKNFEFVLWDKITEHDFDRYKHNLRYLCHDYNCDAFNCNNLNCKIPDHINDLNTAYEYAVKALFKSSAHFLTHKVNNRFKMVPGVERVLP